MSDIEMPYYISPTKEINWIIDEAKKIIEAPTEDGYDKPPYIFNVPKVLKSVKPEGYAPQLLSLGPYHCFRDDLYEMERFKALTVRKVLKNHLTNCTIDKIVGILQKDDFKIRARYEKYLRMSNEDLLSIMAIDGIFLLEFFRACTSDENSKSVINVSPRLSFMVDSKGHTKPSYDLLIRDAMMLENQVPIYALKKILELQFSSLDYGREVMAKLFFDMCKKICPFNIKAAQQNQSDAYAALKSKGHFLGFMYSLINASWEKEENELSLNDHSNHNDGGGGNNNGVKHGCSLFSNPRRRSPKKVFEDLCNAISDLPIVKQGPLRLVAVLKDVVTKILPHLTGDDSKEELNNEGDTIIQVEEIAIPSVAILVMNGVEFKPAKGGLDKIKYDTKTQTLELPIITLDVNSEVIIRNLVAYEAMAISGPQILARYTELMNGIVDTEEDARILKDKGIIKGDLKNQEIANLWNGMSKCIRVTRVNVIDEAIESVNKEFSSLRTVKIYRMCRAYIYGSWKMIMFLATLLVICLMLLQSFCTVYNCPRLFHVETAKK